MGLWERLFGTRNLLHPSSCRVVNEGKLGSLKHTKDNQLISAAERGDTEMVSALLSDGANPNAISQDTFRFTPLMAAASKGHVHTLIILLKRGADPELVTSGRGTSLEIAVQYGRLESVRTLLGTSLRPSARALIDACGYRSNPSLVKLLLDAGADPNAHHDYINGRSSPISAALEGKNSEIIQLLLGYGAHLNKKSFECRRALDDARLRGDTEFIRLLSE